MSLSIRRVSWAYQLLIDVTAVFIYGWRLGDFVKHHPLDGELWFQQLQ